MKLDEVKLYIEDVVLEEICIFIVDYFFHLKLFKVQNYVLSF